jgi:hypothetical protein
MTEWPELRRFFTMPDPIIPRPRNPNLSADGSMFFCFSVCETLSTSKGGVIWCKKEMTNIQEAVSTHISRTAKNILKSHSQTIIPYYFLAYYH